MWRQPDSARTSEQLSACVGDCARSNSGSGEKVDTSTKTTQRVDHLLDTRRPQRNLHLSRSRDLSLRLHRHRGRRDHNLITEAAGSSRAEPKPAAKSMPRRDAPATEFVNAEKPISVTLYNKVLHDYSGTPARSRLNIHVNTIDFALSHIQGPMANSAQQTWRQYLRRIAMYTCLCFQLANTDVIADASCKFSDMGWL